MSDEMRFAVVGLGMGRTHCQDIRDAEGARLVVVCDQVPERVRRGLTEFPGVRGTGGFEEVLRDPEIDVMNQGVHTVDQIQWLCGPVTEVYGKFGVFAHQIESEDKTVAVLTFENGAMGTLTTTTAAYPGLETELVIHGEKGSIVVRDNLQH